MTADKVKTAFIIMPFGKKKDTEGNEIDFDLVYTDVIQEPVEAAGFQPLRCDQIMQAGSIHQDMFTHIATDDLAIVDITLFNPNVFYELGVRHALKAVSDHTDQKAGDRRPLQHSGGTSD